MASTEGDTEATCLVCFETRPLKVVGNCKDRFCTECLSSVLESLDEESEVFACPSCKVECPRPWNGVDGLVDFRQDNADDASDFADAVETPPVIAMETPPVIVEERIVVKEKVWQVIENKCKICWHKKKDVPAVNLCAECGTFYFCQDCTDLHASNKKTRHHIVTRLHPEEKEGVAMCKEHNTDLTSYCATCGTAVCTMCILLLDHEDHVIEDLIDKISSKETEVRNLLEAKEKILDEMRDLEDDLTHMKVIAPLVDKGDSLTKEIEDHAERCIDHIVKWKEDLKKQVKADFKIVQEIPEGLVKVSKIVRKLQKQVTEASQILTESKNQQVYLDKLVSMQRDLEALANVEDDTHGERLYWDKLSQLHWSHHRFIPAVMSPSFGIVEKVTDVNKFKPKEIFKCTMQVNSADMFIPCVVNLGRTFAVAHPTRKGQPANAIDIYEFPGKLVKLLAENLPPIHDMASTPDGQLAVLSTGTGGSGCSVKLFDQEINSIISTCDIDVDVPLSIGVTVQRDYVILGDDKGQRQITIADSNGVVKLKCAIVHELKEANCPNRICCGGRCIFTSSDAEVHVYEKEDDALQSITNYSTGEFKDIAATACDDYFLAWTCSDARKDLILVRYLWNEIKSNNPGKVYTVWKNITGTNREVRISERDGYIVISHGQTIRVLKLGL